MSGDLLGGGLIRELKKHLIHVEFVGIGGPHMAQEGFNSLVAIERLSVMGIGDVLKRYPELYKIRQHLYNEWITNPPDVFIGIDYSSFNLSLAARLKKRGIKTVQFVGPKIWAWKQKRVFYIKKAVDLVLTLFPFEEAFYQRHSVPVQFVGHPLADSIALQHDHSQQKKHLGYIPEDKVIAVLPGSRSGELKYMAPLFLEVMQELSKHDPLIHFIVPIANPKLHEIFWRHAQAVPHRLNLEITNGHAQEAMAAADVVLVKSGTATLEAMLLKRPMVVAFKWGILTHAIIAPQVKIPYISLPNLLAQQKLVPEFIQGRAHAQAIACSVLHLLQSPNHDLLIQQFTDIHQTLKKNANQKAALAILNLLDIV
ncbi:lipid-A-disaccharide synthase [Legionella fallonii]